MYDFMKDTSLRLLFLISYLLLDEEHLVMVRAKFAQSYSGWVGLLLGRHLGIGI
jgi:hypothetical protein